MPDPGERTLRRVAALEGSTLCLLLVVAVPLKHLAGEPAAVRLLGPLHGVVFLLYLWLLLRTAAEQGWRPNRTAGMLMAALLPFGAWLLLRLRRVAPDGATPR